MHDMQCMLVTNPTTLLIGGHHTKVIELDLTTVKEKQQVRKKITKHCVTLLAGMKKNIQ